MNNLLKMLELRIIVALGVSLLLLLGSFALVWRPIDVRLKAAERDLATAESRLREARSLVEAAGEQGLTTTETIADAIRRMEALIPDEVEDLEVARLASSAILANGLQLEQWDEMPLVRIDENVSAVPYQFRVSGDLSSIMLMLDRLPSALGRPLTFREARIDAPAGSGLVFDTRLVMTGVVDIWVYTGNRAVAPGSGAAQDATAAPGTDAAAPGAPEDPDPGEEAEDAAEAEEQEAEDAADEAAGPGQAG